MMNYEKQLLDKSGGFSLRILITFLKNVKTAYLQECMNESHS